MPSRNLYTSTNQPAGLPAVADLSTIVATRNTDNFLYGYDLSGISIYNAGAGAAAWLSKAVLISNKHVLLAKHTIANPNTPFNIAFVNNGNQTFVYTVTQTSLLNANDILIGVLNTTVDSSLKVYKVLPQTFFNLYLKYTLEKQYNPLPAVYFVRYLQNGIMSSNYLDNTCVGDIQLEKYTNVGFNISGITTGVVYGSYGESKRLLGLTAYAGDSGHPIFTILNNELILLGLFVTSTANTQLVPSAGEQIGAFANLSSYISDINNVMTTLAGVNYFLNQSDLSNFSNYNFNQIPVIVSGSNTYSYALKPTFNFRAYPGSTFTLYESGNSVAISNTVVSTDTSISFTPTNNFSYGEKNISALITVSASVVSNLSDVFKYNLLQTPNPIITGIGNSSIYSLTPTIYGTNTPLGPVTSEKRTDIYVNSTLNVQNTVIGNDGSWGGKLTSALTVEVAANITAKSKVTINNVVNQSNDSNTFIYTATRVPPPILSATSPTTNKRPTITLSNILKDSDPTVNYQILMYASTTNPPTTLGSPAIATADGLGGATWTPNLDLSVGTWYFRATQRFMIGNVSNYSNVLTIVIN